MTPDPNLSDIYGWQPSRISCDWIELEIFVRCSNASVHCTKYQLLMMTYKSQKG